MLQKGGRWWRGEFLCSSRKPKWLWHVSWLRLFLLECRYLQVQSIRVGDWSSDAHPLLQLCYWPWHPPHTHTDTHTHLVQTNLSHQVFFSCLLTAWIIYALLIYLYKLFPLLLMFHMTLQWLYHPFFFSFLHDLSGFCAQPQPSEQEKSCVMSITYRVLFRN